MFCCIFVPFRDEINKQIILRNELGQKTDKGLVYISTI